MNAPFDPQLKNLTCDMFDPLAHVALSLTFHLSTVLYWDMLASVDVQGDYRMLYARASNILWFDLGWRSLG